MMQLSLSEWKVYIEVKRKNFTIDEDTETALAELKNHYESEAEIVRIAVKKLNIELKKEIHTPITEVHEPESARRHYVQPPNSVGLYCYHEHGDVPEQKFLMEGIIVIMQPGNIMTFTELTCPIHGELRCPTCNEWLSWTKKMEYYCAECDEMKFLITHYGKGRGLMKFRRAIKEVKE